MPTGNGQQEHYNEVTAPLKMLLELCASQSDRLGSLSDQMANVVSVLNRLSGHIGERPNGAHIQALRLEHAPIGAQPRSLMPSGEHAAGQAAATHSGSVDSLVGVVYPKRVYGAPYPFHGSMAAPLSLADAGIRQASCGNVMLAVGHGAAAYSADGGTTLSPLNPAAIFPHRAAGGACIDQGAQYLPAIDRFVWFMQFGAGITGQICLRIATASPREIICTKCTGWTYWDLNAAQPGFNSGMKCTEICLRHDVLCIRIGRRETGLSVVEIPLDAIRAGGPVHWYLSSHSDPRLRADQLFSVSG